MLDFVVFGTNESDFPVEFGAMEVIVATLPDFSGQFMKGVGDETKALTTFVLVDGSGMMHVELRYLGPFQADKASYCWRAFKMGV